MYEQKWNIMDPLPWRETPWTDRQYQETPLGAVGGEEVSGGGWGGGRSGFSGCDPPGKPFRDRGSQKGARARGEDKGHAQP